MLLVSAHFATVFGRHNNLCMILDSLCRSRRCAAGGNNSVFSPEDPEECYAAVSLLVVVASDA